jgi:hypothetical protein
MTRLDARVRSIRRTRAFVLLTLVVAAHPAGADAAALRLPAVAAPLLASIAAQCAGCPATGYVPCGGPDVGWGTRYAPHAFLGTPRRTYLPTFALSGDGFRKLARAIPDHAALLDVLRTRFAETRLVVVEDAFTTARVLPAAESVAVIFPKRLHECLRDATRPWACCTGDCDRECCEKSLGSPTITLHWTDGRDRITLHYSHTIGISSLDRASHDHHTRYACLTDAKGELRSSRRPPR